MKILLFKTNVDSPADKEKIAEALKPCKQIIYWSIDFEGDRSLMVASAKEINPEEITELIKEAGFECEEI